MKRKLKFKTIEITTEEVIESIEITEQGDFEVLTDEQYEQIKKILSNEQTDKTTAQRPAR